MPYVLSSRALISAVICLALGACGQSSPPPTSTPPPAASASTSETVPHGDHNPHHGGVVMMKGDLHYEVVLDPSGKQHHLYFSDAIREDLPATLASAAALTIHRAQQPDEVVALAVDDSGESWIGHGKPVTVTANATVGVSFTIRGEPYSIELPLKGGDPKPQAP